MARVESDARLGVPASAAHSGVFWFLEVSPRLVLVPMKTF
jgi:hypothetical protein